MAKGWRALKLQYLIIKLLQPLYILQELRLLSSLHPLGSSFTTTRLKTTLLPDCAGSGGGKKAAGQAPSAAGSGVEYTLLILDPSCPTQPLANALQSRSGWQRMVKRGQHTLRAAKYQLMYCAEGLAALGSDDYAALKIVAAAERYA